MRKLLVLCLSRMYMQEPGTDASDSLAVTQSLQPQHIVSMATVGTTAPTMLMKQTDDTASEYAALCSTCLNTLSIPSQNFFHCRNHTGRSMHQTRSLCQHGSPSGALRGPHQAPAHLRRLVLLRRHPSPHRDRRRSSGRPGEAPCSHSAATWNKGPVPRPLSHRYPEASGASAAQPAAAHLL